jgi:hypothetical protein
MQNSCVYNEAVIEGFGVRIPRKDPDEVKLPTVKAKTNIGLSERDMEYAMNERSANYTPFKIIPQTKKKHTMTIRANVKCVD